MGRQYEGLENHIVILGWSDRVERIIGELRREEQDSGTETKPIVIVMPEPDPNRSIEADRVYLIYGGLSDPDVLRKAHLDTAASLLIPTVLQESSASDGETVFSLLAALAVNPHLRVCVEVKRADSGDTLEQICSNKLLSGDIEIVSFETIAERLLAQAAVNRGITRVYSHLLQFNEGNEIYVIQIGAAWIGRTFRELFLDCFERDVILIGYEHGQTMELNPKDRDYIFARGDRAWIIACDKMAGIRVVAPDAVER